jgi:hypothetical protein
LAGKRFRRFSGAAPEHQNRIESDLDPCVQIVAQRVDSDGWIAVRQGSIRGVVERGSVPLRLHWESRVSLGEPMPEYCCYSFPCS